MAGLEGVEGMMKKLQLSAEEKKGVKIGWVSGGQVGMVEPQALGRLFSEKPAFAEGLAGALGRAWCPLKGIHCKSVGENIFMFTFYQASGKRKALEEGPWMFENDLLLMEEFDVNKTADEYKFESFPIWIRIFNLPLGRMNRKTGEEMGDAIGEFIDVETDANGMAPGKYLRVKVRLQVNKPLLRGMMVTFGEDNREKWCRFEYEYLPNFCFTCGKVGHIDKACSIQLKRGEMQQFGKWLKWTPNQKGPYPSDKGSWSGRRGTENKIFGSFRNGGNGPGIDSLSWRKDKNPSIDRSGSGKGDEGKVSSPLKLTDGSGVGADCCESVTDGTARKEQVIFEIDKGQREGYLAGDSGTGKDGALVVGVGDAGQLACPVVQQKLDKKENAGNDNALHGACNIPEADKVFEAVHREETPTNTKSGEPVNLLRKYKRQKKDRVGTAKIDVSVGVKRKVELSVEVDKDLKKKKNKNKETVEMEGVVMECDKSVEAGLPGQLRGPQ
ncbi:hypothetical protein QYE76_009841 [Lolium multiflorum]|uniref:CCHC-type domain-containing protein n=1 Tax=Lolium multiflorum TaxID=4521 RepID=A0AAD8TW27_LOLMU|nr:hypothetical protein QYE76_009841 [Lolium multiflorum]